MGCVKPGSCRVICKDLNWHGGFHVYSTNRLLEKNAPPLSEHTFLYWEKNACYWLLTWKIEARRYFCCCAGTKYVWRDNAMIQNWVRNWAWQGRMMQSSIFISHGLRYATLCSVSYAFRRRKWNKVPKLLLCSIRNSIGFARLPVLNRYVLAYTNLVTVSDGEN